MSTVCFDNVKSFCEAFWHMDKIYEWSVFSPICLDPPPFSSSCLETQQQQEEDKRCRRWIVNAIAQLELRRNDNDDRNTQPNILYSKRYVNEFRGNTNHNQHAEESMCADQDLIETLVKTIETINQKTESIALVVYLGYQPCHHSAGGRNYATHQKSCSSLLSAWYQKVLENTGLTRQQFQLRIKCCALYRVHWDDQSYFKGGDEQLFGGKVNSALEGMMLCRQAGIVFESMTPKEWNLFVTRYCDDKKVAKLISNEMWQQRYQYDQLVHEFMSKYNLL